LRGEIVLLKMVLPLFLVAILIGCNQDEDNAMIDDIPVSKHHIKYLQSFGWENPLGVLVRSHKPSSLSEDIVKKLNEIGINITPYLKSPIHETHYYLEEKEEEKIYAYIYEINGEVIGSHLAKQFGQEVNPHSSFYRMEHKEIFMKKH
jgi:hypothetical protein